MENKIFENNPMPKIEIKIKTNNSSVFFENLLKTLVMQAVLENQVFYTY